MFTMLTVFVQLNILQTSQYIVMPKASHNTLCRCACIVIRIVSPVSCQDTPPSVQSFSTVFPSKCDHNLPKSVHQITTCLELFQSQAHSLISSLIFLGFTFAK